MKIWKREICQVVDASTGDVVAICAEDGQTATLIAYAPLLLHSMQRLLTAHYSGCLEEHHWQFAKDILTKVEGDVCDK